MLFLPKNFCECLGMHPRLTAGKPVVSFHPKTQVVSFAGSLTSRNMQSCFCGLNFLIYNYSLRASMISAGLLGSEARENDFTHQFIQYSCYRVRICQVEITKCQIRRFLPYVFSFYSQSVRPQKNIPEQ